MAWNPSPTVAAARDFGDRFEKQQVIIISVDVDNYTLQMVSYGKTKQLCADAKRIGDVAYDAIMDFWKQGG